MNDRTFAEIDVLSFYLNDEISITDSLNLLLGVRFDDMDIDVVDAKTAANSGDDRDFTTSPRVGLTFDITKEAMLYGATVKPSPLKPGTSMPSSVQVTANLIQTPSKILSLE